MENPSSNTPESFDYNSLPPLTSQSHMQNLDFSTLGSSSSSSPFPLFDDYYSTQTVQQNVFIQQNQLHQPSPSSSSSHDPFASSSTYAYPNMFSLETNGVANYQHYYSTYSNLDQMGSTGILQSWQLPFNIEHIGNYGGITSASASSLVDVGQQQRPYGPTISSSPPTSVPLSSSFASLMHHSQNLSLTLQYSPYTQDFSLFPSLDHLGYRFVLQKELKNSDVNNIGRIVLPKRESESNLPFLSVKEGIQLSVMELFNPYIWRMRYRFWPNNKSRMYVLENTGEFIRRHGLRSGDYIALYQDMSKQLYICSRRVERPLQVPVPSPSISLGTSTPENQIPTQQQPTISGGGEPETSLAQAVDAVRYFDMPMDSTDNTFHFTDPSPSFFDITNYNTRQLESLPNIEDCDLSIFDAAPEKTGDGVLK